MAAESHDYNTPSVESLRGRPDMSPYELRELFDDEEPMIHANFRLSAVWLGPNVVSVGTIVFCPEIDVHAYMAEHPDAPIVLDSGHSRIHQQQKEVAHMVFARLAMDADENEEKLLLDNNDCPIIDLFTMATDADGKVFEHFTHFKNGQQYNGVDISDWALVNFSPSYQAATLPETWEIIFGELLSIMRQNLPDL